MAVGFRGAGGASGGVGALTLTWPGSQQENDFALLLHEVTSSQSPSAPSGWTEVSGSPITNATYSHRFYLYGKLVGVSESSVTVADSGDHQVAQILVFSGVDTTTPIEVTATSNPGPATALAGPGVTTTSDGAGVVYIFGLGRDADSTAGVTDWANSNLVSITEIADFLSSAGGGGGFAAAWGIKTTAGATGDTTATQSASAVYTAITVALKPDAGGAASQTNTASGSITFNGDGSFAFGLALAASGSLSFNQGASIAVGKALDAEGFLNFSGNASESHSGTQSQTNNASGSLSLSGDAALSSGLVLTTAGSLAFTQGANISYGVVNVPTGSLLFSGAAGMSSGGPSIPGSDFNWRSRGYGR